MNTAIVERIANAVLYEGYVLYPYRASALKNRQRFNFGVLYPPEYTKISSGADLDSMQTQCLMVSASSMHGTMRETTIESKLRFLHLIASEQWQEGQEREVTVPAVDLASLVAKPLRHPFAFCGARDAEGRFSIHRGRMRTQRNSGS